MGLDSDLSRKAMFDAGTVQQIETDYSGGAAGGVAVLEWRGLQAACQEFAFGGAVDNFGKQIPRGITSVRIYAENFPFYKVTAQLPVSGGNLTKGVPSQSYPVLTLCDLEPSYEERELSGHPSLSTELLKILDPGNRSKLYNDMIAVGNGQSIYDTTQTPPSVVPSTQIVSFIITEAKKFSPVIDVTVIVAFLGELCRGITKYRSDNVSFVRRQTAPADFLLDLQYEQVGHFLTTQSLISYNQAWLTPTILKNLSTTFKDGFWLHTAPRLAALDLGRIEATSVFIYADNFSTVIFGDAL